MTTEPQLKSPKANSSNTPVIGFMGTAKNTGKTTALSQVLYACVQRGQRAVVTGIGYDGEVIDNLTELPKPRLHFPVGSFVATAGHFLDSSEARLDILKDSHIANALGMMVLGRVTHPGKLVIAGPPTRHGLAHMLPCLKQQGEVVLVDGSISRLVPLMECDAVVVATGAARSTNLNVLAQEAEAIANIFGIGRAENLEHHAFSRVTIKGEGTDREFPFNSMFSRREWLDVESQLSKKAARLIVPGAFVSDAFLLWLQQREECLDLEIIVQDPSSLLAGVHASEISGLFSIAEERGVMFTYLRPVPILVFTINPFYPKKRFRGQSFEPAYIDSGVLRKRIEEAVSVPVVNVFEDGVETILEEIRRSMARTEGNCHLTKPPM